MSGKSYPMMEKKGEVRNPVIKETFEVRIARYKREFGGRSSLGEHSVCIREVAGSTPVASTGELNEMDNKEKSVKKKN